MFELFDQTREMVRREGLVYGRSPAMTALGDIMQLQQETRRKAELIEKPVRPPARFRAQKVDPASLPPVFARMVLSPGPWRKFNEGVPLATATWGKVQAAASYNVYDQNAYGWTEEAANGSNYK